MVRRRTEDLGAKAAAAAVDAVVDAVAVAATAKVDRSNNVGGESQPGPSSRARAKPPMKNANSTRR